MKKETAYCNILFMLPTLYYDHHVNNHPLIGAKEMKGNTVDSFYSSLFCTACPPNTQFNYAKSSFTPSSSILLQHTSTGKA